MSAEITYVGRDKSTTTSSWANQIDLPWRLIFLYRYAALRKFKSKGLEILSLSTVHIHYLYRYIIFMNSCPMIS